MIYKEFKSLKFQRSYIGGSRRNEDEMFLKVQGTQEDDYSDCDWLEFRKLLIKYWDDILHVFMSWEYFIKILTICLFITSIVLFKFQQISLIMFGVSIISFLTFIFIRKKRIRIISNYDFTLSIVSNEIKKIFGLDFIV